MRDAINSASAGVTASIINDGTGNRLVLASTATGAANGFRIATTDSDGGNLDASGLSQLAFDPSAAGGTTQTQHVADAVNARFTLDGLSISKPDNHVTDAIAGLTLDLKTVTTASTAFTITRNTTSAAANIAAFVSAYNTIATGIASLTSYNPTTKTAGTLNGDSSMRLISTRLQGLLAAVVPTGGSITALGDIGIKFGSDGTLSVDSTKLNTALNSDPNAVAKLFAKTGTSTDALVSYVDSTTKTQAGSHALTVSQLATNGSVTGSAPAGLTITAGVNDTFSLTLDNVSSTVTLDAGTYGDANAAGVGDPVQDQRHLRVLDRRVERRRHPDRWRAEHHLAALRLGVQRRDQRRERPRRPVRRDARLDQRRGRRRNDRRPDVRGLPDRPRPGRPARPRKD